MDFWKKNSRKPLLKMQLLEDGSESKRELSGESDGLDTVRRDMTLSSRSLSLDRSHFFSTLLQSLRLHLCSDEHLTAGYQSYSEAGLLPFFQLPQWLGRWSFLVVASWGWDWLEVEYRRDDDLFSRYCHILGFHLWFNPV